MAEPGQESGSGGDAVTVEDQMTLRGEEAQTARGFETWGPGIDGVDLSRGQSIGRYLILERIGSGGMGVVYAAYDPELDRKVAVKLLRPGTHGSASASIGEQRLLREARAMARLAAPNVVTVHDIGTIEGHVYVAMEFVDGKTLRKWLDTSPPWQEVLRVFVEAGRGLSAAHEAGMIHRDFKPDNVMIGNDGRILVMDFGLVRSESGEQSPAESSASGMLDGDELVESSRTDNMLVTRAGAVMGTPAYMAPEQHMGLATDARTDQFSYCVALYEALWGQHPFAADSLAALALKITDGDVAPPPKSSKVPVWIRKAVLRGLEAQPDDRFPSMQTLLVELDRDPRAARSRWILGGALVLLTGGAVLGWAREGDDPAAMICEGAKSRLQGVWDDGRREAVAEAFAASDLVFAADTSSRVQSQLDDYARQWVAGYEVACEATHLLGEQSDALLDRRMLCLEERRDALNALVDVFAEADAQVVMHAVSATSKLPPLQHCSDAEALLSEVPPPADEATATEVRRIRRELARADALESIGRYAEGSEISRDALSAATALDYPPLTAEALRVDGILQQGLGEYEDAERQLTSAVRMARTHRHDHLATDAAITLVAVVGFQRGDPSRAEAWMAIADADVERLDDSRQRAQLAGNRGVVLDEQLRHREAIESFEAALGFYAEADMAESLAAAETTNNLGASLYGRGDYEAAERRYEEALALLEARLGGRHPSVAAAIGNIALTARKQGKLDEARSDYMRALELKREVLGDDHPSVAYTLGGLATVELMLGDVEEATKHSRSAVELRRATLGPGHPLVATSLNNLGNIQVEAGEYEAAQATLEQAIAILLEARGPDHADIADYRDSLGEALLGLGKPREALAQHTMALEMRTRAPEVAAAQRAFSLIPLGRCLLALGQRSEAIERLEEALRLRSESDTAGHLKAEASFALATALTEAESERAVQLAHGALADYGSSREHRREVEQIEAWLAERASTD